MQFISYAQNYEDVMLWRALKHIENGFYVDVGANDPEEHSLTKAFYDRGWNGINVEPIAGWYKRLVSERPRDINLQVAAGKYDGEVRLFEVVDTGLSTSNEDYAKEHAKSRGFKIHDLVVPVQTLSSILQAQSIFDIHFLKVDVEGSEKDVLEGLDLSRFRPWILVIEATMPLTTTPDHQQWEYLITEQDYQFVYFDGLNRFYIANEHSDLYESFVLPPNYWDEYERAREYNAKQQAASSKEQADLFKEQAASSKEQADLFKEQAASFKEQADLFKEQTDLFKEQVASLSAELREQKAATEALDVSFQAMLNSRSMKLTVPLRKGLTFARKLKSLTKSLPKKIVQTVIEQPRLRRIAKPIASKFPILQYRLRFFLYKESPSSVASLSQLNDKELSRRSARVLQDLKQILK